MDVCSALLSVSPTRKCVLKKKNKIKWKVKKRNLWVWYPAERHLHISGPRESEILPGMVQPPSNKACLHFFPIGRGRLLYKERGGSQDKITRDVGMSWGGTQKNVFAESFVPIHPCFCLLQLWLQPGLLPSHHLFWQWLKPDDHNPDYPIPGILLPNQTHKNVWVCYKQLQW